MTLNKRLQASRDRAHMRWGIVTLLVLIPALYLGFTKSIPFRPHYEIKAVFSSAATQLKSGSPVRIAGVNVGKVSGVERGAGTTALVTMRILDKGRPISSDATAKIRPRLFLEGNFFVDLKPGVNGVELEDNDTIPITQTAIPVQFDQMLQTFNVSGRTDLRTTIRELAAGLDQGGAAGLNETFDSAPQGLRGLASTMHAFRGVEPNDLSRFIANTATVSDAFTTDTAALAGLIRGLDGTLTALGSRAEPFADSLDLASQAFAKFPALRREALALVDPAVRLADALGPALDELPGTLRPTITLLRAAQPLLADDQLPRLARTLRPALADLSALTPGLRRAFTQITPVAQCVRDNLVPVLNGKVDDGPLTTGLKVWEELVRFPVGLAGASANFNGNGPGLRLVVGGSEQLIATTSPNLGNLVSVGERPLSGARPRYRPGVSPPFSPDTDCRSQDVPSLVADTAPAPTQRAISVPAAEKAQQLAKARRKLARLKRKAAR
jgi:virulence factor Mce-like protein